MKPVRALSSSALMAVFTFFLAVASATAATPPIISQGELNARIEQGKAPLILDVRTGGEFSKGHIPGAKNFPHTKLMERAGRIAGYQQKEVVLYCEEGPRANFAHIILQQHGFTKIRHLDGHMSAWREAGLPIE